MPKRHGACEQRRLSKKKAKDRDRRRQLARSTSPDPNIRLKDAEQWPVEFALVPEELWSEGLGNLVIARRAPKGQLACAVFLVDVFCLGVKDATWNIIFPAEFHSVRKDLESSCGRFQAVPPEYFAKLIYRAADYGQSLGFPPHRDFRHEQRLLAGIDPSACPEEFQFGKDGRPYYFRGPNESLAKARVISERVDSLGGEYVVPLKESELEEFDADELDFVAEADDDEMLEYEPRDEHDMDERSESPRRFPWLQWR